MCVLFVESPATLDSAALAVAFSARVRQTEQIRTRSSSPQRSGSTYASEDDESESLDGIHTRARDTATSSSDSSSSAFGVHDAVNAPRRASEAPRRSTVSGPARRSPQRSPRHKNRSTTGMRTASFEGRRRHKTVASVAMSTPSSPLRTASDGE